MLRSINIRNIALIESLSLEFGRGLNVLSGETGAGKSIVVDAIGAVVGGRTSREIIRTGAKSARVEANCTALPDLPWFAENGIAPDEDGNLLIQREIQSDGKNVCRLNGRLLTVSQLRELGRQILNIHGQHDGQQLLDESCHLSYLDSFGALGEQLSDYQSAYGTLGEIRREMSALRMDEAEKARRIDALHYQISELERANLQPGEDETLTERRKLLRNAGRLIEAVEETHRAISGDDDSAGAAALLSEAERAL